MSLIVCPTRLTKGCVSVLSTGQTVYGTEIRVKKGLRIKAKSASRSPVRSAISASGNIVCSFVGSATLDGGKFSEVYGFSTEQGHQEQGNAGEFGSMPSEVGSQLGTNFANLAHEDLVLGCANVEQILSLHYFSSVLSCK